MLSYQTDKPLSDVSALQREADGIFKYVRVDAERGGYSAMVLSATQDQGGVGPLQDAAGYRFVYERSASGQWKRDD